MKTVYVSQERLLKELKKGSPEREWTTRSLREYLHRQTGLFVEFWFIGPRGKFALRYDLSRLH